MSSEDSIQDVTRNADKDHVRHFNFAQQAPGEASSRANPRAGCIFTSQPARGPEINKYTREPDVVVDTGVGGGTSISMQRRMFDARFATRYFVGTGIDVGGGYDPLTLYKELFPLIEKVIPYDKEQGDAQKLANVPDETFNFLYSSHCLEHMDDPYEALDNWIRVVKLGGHLVISVPDEDLYEQGHWPSIYNPDHRHTFTISKSKSWSPVSLNVCDLICLFRGVAKIISIMTIDHAYRYELSSFPHTRTPLSECAIEFVLKKFGARA